MAVIHDATLTPSKLELLVPWLATRPWCDGPGDVEKLGTYRFDDPAGEVGIETFLLGTADGSVLHVPVTYRPAPVDDAEEHLIGTMRHSVLGRRWVYDGCADPVWAGQLLTVVLTGGTEVGLYLDGETEPLPASATVRGSGTPGTPVDEVVAVAAQDGSATTVVRAGAREIVVVRVVGSDMDAAHVLTGRWDRGGPAVLAGVRDA